LRPLAEEDGRRRRPAREFSAQDGVTTMTNTTKKRAAAPKMRQRQRAMPSPMAFAFTVRDAQMMGGPGKTKLYDLDRQLKAEGKPLLFKDAAGRTMVNGDGLRELLGVNATA
jgi:hypothetical protein